MSLEAVIKRIHPLHSSSRVTFAPLDGLRGVAILVVVLGHYWTIAAGSLTERPNVDFYAFDITNTFKLAGYGVDLFFVLSAFLLYLPYASMTVIPDFWAHLRNFYLRRFCRIYPAYLSLTVIYVLMLRTFSNTDIAVSDLLANLMFFQPFAVFLPNSLISPSILEGTWSLVVEIYFYAILPFFALLVRRTGALAVVSLVLTGVALYYRSSMYPVINLMDVSWQQRTILLLNPIPYLDSFIVGIISARIFSHLSGSASRKSKISAIAFTAFGFAGFITVFLFPFSSLTVGIFSGLRIDIRLLFNLSAGSLIVGVLLRRSIVSTMLSSTTLRFIGICSYSLFLIHMTLARTVAVPLMDAFDVTDFASRIAVLVSIFIPVAVFTSMVLYIAIERPFLSRDPVLKSAHDVLLTFKDISLYIFNRKILVFLLIWYGAASFAYNGIYRPEPQAVVFTAANFTDVNWSSGVSRRENTILVSAKLTRIAELKNMKSLILENGSTVKIISIIDAEREWIHINTQSISAKLMESPHRLIAVK